MADKTWVGGTSDDAAVDANWSPSGVPASNDKVAIPDASTTSNDCRLTAATSWGTLSIATDGILVGNGQTLTLNGGVNDGGTAADFNYTDAGQTTNVSGNLDITMRNLRSSGDRAIITAAANNIRNLKIDDFTADGGGTGKVYHFQTHLTISGNLTVEYGELNTAFSSTSYNLTVAGAIDVASGGALTCNSSAVQCNGLRTTGGTVNLPDASGSFTVKGTEFSGYGIYDRVGSGNIVHNGGTVTWDIGGMSTMYALSTFNNITTTTSGTTLRWFSALTLAGDLTVAANTTVHEHSSAGGAFTVGGDVDVSGTLGNSDAYSAYSFGSLTINSGGTYVATSGTTTVSKESDTGGTDFMFHNDGTFTHNDGKFVFDDAGLSSNSNVRCSSSFYDVEVTMGSFSLTSHHNMNAARDFTVTTGTYNDGSNGFTITRDTIVENGATLNLSNSSTQTKTLGGLHLKSGSSFRACRGTTVISNRVTGTSNVWKNDGGTFNHNNGTVKFTDNDHSLVKEAGSFYNFEQASSLGDYALLWETGGGGSCTILNNLTITRGDFEVHAATDTLDIHGQTIINGSSNSGARFNNDKNQTATITHHGLVTIIQGTYHVEDGATVNMAGIRNLGGVVD
jgi:hypothetical protein